MKHLEYVYIGNVIEEHGNNTYCPTCGKPVIKRTGYRIQVLIENKKCLNCGETISVVKE